MGIFCVIHQEKRIKVSALTQQNEREENKMGKLL